MMDREKALEILGLKEDSSVNDAERRYYVLLKKHRMKSSAEAGQQDDGPTLDEITEAYNVLTGKVVKMEEFKPSPFFKKLNVDERKLRNFLHYYKWHIIIGIACVLAIVSIVKSVLRPKPDFNIAFIGEISYYDAVEYLEEKAQNEIDKVKLASVDGAAFLLKEMEHDMSMKAAVLIAGGDVDVYVMDGPKFRTFAAQMVFLRLEDTLKILGIPADDERLHMAKAEEDDQSYVYGIDVSDCELLKEAGVFAKEMIISIDSRVNTESYDKAVEFLKIVLEIGQPEITHQEE